MEASLFYSFVAYNEMGAPYFGNSITSVTLDGPLSSALLRPSQIRNAEKFALEKMQAQQPSIVSVVILNWQMLGPMDIGPSWKAMG
ncbi:hypothetical protein [Methylobacterium sp. Gmos1]